jgi:hypothetical protein
MIATKNPAASRARSTKVERPLVAGPEHQQLGELVIEEPADGDDGELQRRGGEVEILRDVTRVEQDAAVAALPVLPHGFAATGRR